MMDMLSSPDFWIAVGQIIMIDILLGGDNAVVIALACRKLPPAQRTQGILWGTAGAIGLRVVATQQDVDHDDLADRDPEIRRGEHFHLVQSRARSGG